MTRRRGLIALLLAAPLMAGCGRQGDLRPPDRPSPPPSPAPADDASPEDPGT